MIAIIENTFARVNEEKEAYMYSNKAEMNAQCYRLLHHVKKLEVLDSESNAKPVKKASFNRSFEGAKRTAAEITGSNPPSATIITRT